MCRRSGLEQKRRCGWLGVDAGGSGRPVWGRKHVVTDRCPTSYITAESQMLIEEFLVLRRLGARSLDGLTARQVDAFVILESELAIEVRDGQHNNRQNL